MAGPRRRPALAAAARFIAVQGRAGRSSEHRWMVAIVHHDSSFFLLFFPFRETFSISVGYYYI
jgi:hypothetical protein